MKYYYNGVLVRTSKNHKYRFAVVDISKGENMKALTASANTKACVSYITGEINHCNKQSRFHRDVVKAIDEGKKKFRSESGYLCEVNYTREEALGYAEGYERDAKYIEQNYKVVELEGVE